jgi:hypothetical protein
MRSRITLQGTTRHETDDRKSKGVKTDPACRGISDSMGLAPSPLFALQCVPDTAPPQGRLTSRRRENTLGDRFGCATRWTAVAFWRGRPLLLPRLLSHHRYHLLFHDHHLQSQPLGCPRQTLLALLPR